MLLSGCICKICRNKQNIKKDSEVKNTIYKVYMLITTLRLLYGTRYSVYAV